MGSTTLRTASELNYDLSMPRELRRQHRSGDFHFITFSCDDNRPYLAAPAARDLFQRSLEKMRLRYQFCVIGYVIMPNHVHLLLSEPKIDTLATAIQAVKLSVTKQRQERPFWLPRYHDFNVFTPAKRTEKLKYLHRNPVNRGLVADPADWPWSSFRHYLTGEPGAVEIESDWTANKRDRARSKA
jgi:putative transposase